MSPRRSQPSGGSSFAVPGGDRRDGVFQSRANRDPSAMVEMSQHDISRRWRAFVKALCGMKMRARACACQPRKRGLQGAELMWLGRLRATFTRDHHDCIYRKHKTVGLPSLRQNVATEETEIATVDWRNSRLKN